MYVIVMPSAHSLRSSLFNASTTEIILMLFREDNAVHMGPSYYEEEDPTIQEALTLQHAQNPNSWVSKSLAWPDLWGGDEFKASIQALTPLRLLNTDDRAIKRKVSMPSDCNQNPNRC